MDERESILIVDDDASVRSSLELALRENGYRAESAATGREALEKARQKSFDLALIENRLPDVTGTRLIEDLKRLCPEIALIMVTGFASFEAAVEALEKGASAYITKPISMDEALAKVEESVLKQRLVRQNKTLLEAARRELAQRKSTEEALRESSALLERIFDNTHMMIAYMDPDFNFIRVNRAYAEADRKAPEFFVGKNHFDLYPHEENEEIFRTTVRTGQTYFAYEKPFTYRDRPDVITYWDWSLQPIKDEEGRVDALVLCLINVTDRKLAHERIRTYQRELRSLVSQLSLAEQRERRRVATALHDYIGQSLALSRIMLGALGESAPSGELAQSIEEVRGLIERSLDDTRALIFDLSPPLLYEVGLEAALEKLAEEVQQQHGIRVEFEDDGLSKPADEILRVVLFQCARELVINAVKHARASRVEVRTEAKNGEIHVTVLDDGGGFDTSSVGFRMHEGGGFGLFNVRERMDGLGGRFEIWSQQGKGTRATLVAPMSTDVTATSKGS